MFRVAGYRAPINHRISETPATMRRANCKKLSNAQVARLEERQKALGLTQPELLARFDAALKNAGCVYDGIGAAKMRLDRVFNPRMRRGISEGTKAAVAHALGWNVPEFEAAISEKKDGARRDERKERAGVRASAQQIGFKALVQIGSHQITRGVDLSNDNLPKVYEAAYRMFLRIRELMGDLPVDEFSRGRSAQRIYEALNATLNETLRPHLTKWPEQYCQWRDGFVKTKAGSKLSAQDLQKHFPQRQTLMRELKEVAQSLKVDARKLKALVFAKGKKTKL